MKQVIRFIATCLCIVIPVASLSAYLSLEPLAYMDGESPYFYWNKEMTTASHEEYYDTIILGDSTANAAFEPALLSAGTLNLALGGVSPIETYYIAKDWLKNNPAPKVCYIGFGDDHLESNNSFWSRTIYMHRFRLGQNLEIMKDAIRYKDESMLTDDYIMDFLAYQIWAPSKYVTALVNAKGNQRYEINQAAKDLVALHQGRYMTMGVGEYSPGGEKVYDKFQVKQIYDRYYRRLIQLLLENDITVRLIKLPMADNVVFTDGYKEDFYNYYDLLLEEYPDVTLDWMSAYSAKYYLWDSVHLNSHGALKFSNEIKKKYPDDFQDGELNPQQIDAINDSIRAENKIEEILKWINGRDYAVIFRDKSGDFERVYNESILPELEEGYRSLELHSLGQEASGMLYYVSGVNSDQEEQVIGMANELISRPDADGGQPGNGVEENVLEVSVVDNYNDSVVFDRSFRNSEGHYVLA